MAIEVKGWRKPKLTLSLVAGGTLLPNTTYYVCGYLKFTPVVYGAVGSPLSDVYSITTDSTNRSIQIDQITERDITAFASGGGSVTNVTCPLHCVKTGDVIKIDTGSYAGSWTITKIDKDTFSIPTAYIDNVAVVCYTDSVNYNRPTLAGYSTNSFCMTYYVSKINPINISGYWSATSYSWTSTPFQAFNYTNPTVITSQPAQYYMSSRSGSLTASFIGKGMFAPVVPYGTILVYITASHTFQEIYDAIIAEGFPYNCYYSSTENTFMLVGSIIGNGAGHLTATGMNITMVCGELYNSTPANFSFNGCLINTMPRLSQASYKFTANQAVIYNNSTRENALYGYIYGVETYHRAPMLLYGNDGTTSYTNLQTGDVFTNVSLIQDKIFIDNYVTSNIGTAYGLAIFKRDTLLPMYWILINAAKNYEPSVYMIEDCIINEAGNNHWHFRFYQYPAQDGKVNIVKFLNIDTDDSLNRKKCINNRIGNYNISFYRRNTFYIKDENGDPIQGATIKLSGDEGVDYTSTTGVDGSAYIDFKEQKFYKTSTQGTEGAWSGIFDTYYQITNIEITANNFISYSATITNNHLESILALAAIPEEPVQFLPLPVGYTGELTGPLAPTGGDNPLGGEMFIGGGLDSDQANLLKDSIYNNYINEKTIRVPKNTINGQEVTSEIIEITIASALSQGLITQESLTDLRQLSDTMADTIIEHIKTYAETEGATNEIIDLKDHVSTVNNNILQLYDTLSSWVPVTMDGGGALKIALSSVLPDMTAELTQNEANMQSTFIYETMDKNII